MKKIDLHIHTVPTVRDSTFTFCLDTFKRYVEEAHLDAVAITNHDLFDGAQFRQVAEGLKIVVLPGVEVTMDTGHLLVIGDPSELQAFETRAGLVSQQNSKLGDTLSVEDLKAIFGDLGDYLLIPHSDKVPPIGGATLEQLRPYISAGEVDSAKKFIRAIGDPTRPTPVLFSDSRVCAGLTTLPTRQTFVDCGALTLGALKTCLRDKTKVALSEADGNRLWQVFEDGQMLSTGLNVLIGARSTGKTYTLDRISKAVETAKYIRQFSLVQQDEATCERDFKSDVERRRSVFVDQYLSGLKRVLEEVMKVDSVANDRRLERYIETLLKSAEEADRQDAFSKAALFDEQSFPVGNTSTLSALIESVRQVIENVEFRDVIEKHTDLQSLRGLARELIELLWARTLEYEKKKVVNGLVAEVKRGLSLRTSAIQVEDVDLYEDRMDAKRVERFGEIVGFLKRETVIFEESIQGFRIEARKGPYAGAGEIRTASGNQTAFSDAFRTYANPYEYLRELLNNDRLQRSELYRLFAKISYKVLNADGFEVSGGERSEFRLLQEIADAQNFDILLIDEPESSFDNLFLKSDVNKILKGISETMPVVVVTHNSTVGASIDADYLLHTRKELEEGRPEYRIYSGYPTDVKLLSADGKAIGSHGIMMDSLEAGVAAYESRRGRYEAIEDR